MPATSFFLRAFVSLASLFDVHGKPHAPTITSRRVVIHRHLLAYFRFTSFHMKLNVLLRCGLDYKPLNVRKQPFRSPALACWRRSPRWRAPDLRLLSNYMLMFSYFVMMCVAEILFKDFGDLVERVLMPSNET